MNFRSLIPCASLLLAVAAVARAVCPSNHMQAGSTIADSSLPADASSGGGCNPYGCTSSSVSYDIPHAGLSLRTSVSGDAGAYAKLTVQDDFRLIGLAPGGSAALIVRLQVNSLYCVATLRDANGHELSGAGDYDNNNVALSLPITAVEDQPFRLQFELVGYGDYFTGGAYGSGVFSFDGVPGGAAIVSCNGYVSDITVPVRTTSWGKLKSMYH